MLSKAASFRLVVRGPIGVKETNRVERVVIEKAGGRWQSREGLRVGTTLAELEKILGGPFPITPYGQDGGGAVGEVRNNALARHLYIRLTYGEKQLAAGDEKAMFGEKPFRSDNPAARRAGLTVSVIWWDVERWRGARASAKSAWPAKVPSHRNTLARARPAKPRRRTRVIPLGRALS